jgi:hypothetical protein
VAEGPPRDLISDAAFNLEARSADEFIADTAMLVPGRAVPAIKRMRERWQKTSMTPDELLLLMEPRGLLERPLPKGLCRIAVTNLAALS